MKDLSISLLTICGLTELEQHGSSGVTHVLSILDPDRADPEDFASYDKHHRTTLRFHDIIQPMGDMILPEPKDVEAVLKFGEELSAEPTVAADAHVLVHCHMGVSRSTAAMTTLLCQLHPEADEDAVLAHLRSIRPQIWPNSRMIGFADAALGKEGRLTKALARLYAQQLEWRPEIATFMETYGRQAEVQMGRTAA